MANLRDDGYLLSGSVATVFNARSTPGGRRMIDRGMTINNIITKLKREKGMVDGDVDVRAIPEPRV